ncbi:MAG: T9SS type A sorting domain-containing protein [Bacteroidetes bacterium]|nr:MAG: T9SS type A sorting domain-containing protein [Bacteroidota bacterium]
MKHLCTLLVVLLWAGLITAQDLEFGDAPEGAIAYPAQGTVGQFPTCMTVGPAMWIQHTNFGAFFAPAFDYEGDGNAGICPQFPPYDADECYADNDAGLIFPQPYTITPPPLQVVPCPNSQGTSLGLPCTPAVWGQNIDIQVVNNMPNNTTGFVNVLFDWDLNGLWAGASICPTGAAQEHVLINWPIPNGFAGPLSALGPPPFLTGPLTGFFWARFSITERPVAVPWMGDGAFEDGETEDYLIYVGEYDFGDAPEGAVAYPGSGVIGMFPTCMNVGPPGSFVRHTFGAAFLGPILDGEMEGNAGNCPAFAPNLYDQDECFLDGDAGLIAPGAYTIVGNQVLPCPGGAGLPLQKFCATAQWGRDVDITVTGPGFVNVLMDWDQNGSWAYNANTLCQGTPVPEHVLVDFPVPAGYSGPLSGLNPPNFMVGPNTPYVWSRFTISDVPVGTNNWNGSGDFMDGETEDYLLEISLTSSTQGLREQELPFRVVPNPAKDRFRVDLELMQTEPVRIELIGADGRLVRVLQDATLPKGPHALEFNVPVNTFPDGLYIIRVWTASGGQGRTRLVLQR